MDPKGSFEQLYWIPIHTEKIKTNFLPIYVGSEGVRGTNSDETRTKLGQNSDESQTKLGQNSDEIRTKFGRNLYKQMKIE